ncbi:MAG: hydrogenobyrinic acid a,c-diamide synthase (glutamine-hydrolyzing) [Dehalococcoidia bacterium]|nr:MAG: hydrogenobyrinic acid a,c-diamide synthase (glutamine-hydrolyzing) [Dehalococcoidia bacterium]
MRTSKTSCSGVLISAPQGRSGKTTISLALCALLRNRGITVQPFKKGPDYIDPSWLTGAAGRSCRNMDLFMMSEETLISSFQQACRGADIAVVEGAMGLYDGLDSGWGSTAQVARLLNLPVILVVNTVRMTNSIAAMVMGYQRFQPDINMAGIILNNVSGARHERKLRTSVERHCGIPVLGSVPRDHDLHVDERHLGLIPFPESQQAVSIVDRICRKLGPHLDLDAILGISHSFETGLKAQPPKKIKVTERTQIGVMLDSVFNFYYPENLEALTAAGAELIFIDSTKDRLPEIEGLYIGGGFPEFFLDKLVANDGLRQDIAAATEEGLPIYAECAGLMYLCRGIRWQGQYHEMVGVLPAEVEIAKRPQGHGYTVVEVTGENPFFPIGTTLRGQEFHHSKLINSDKLNFAYKIRRGRGIDGTADGIVHKNVFAAYTHLHAYGAPTWAEAFVALASRECKRQPSLAKGLAS